MGGEHGEDYNKLVWDVGKSFITNLRRSDVDIMIEHDIMELTQRQKSAGS